VILFWRNWGANHMGVNGEAEDEEIRCENKEMGMAITMS
jgi:hypothetical protein